MSTSDGSVIGTTKIVDHGPASQRYNLVLIAEGYRASEMNKFHTDAQAFVDHMFQTPPFDQLQCAFNIYRVDVTSTDSGADDPTACGGSGATAATYFDATFCGDGVIQRLLTVDAASVINVVDAQVPQHHRILVIVNSSTYGGSGGSVGVTSVGGNWLNVGMHEMGHAVFGLADEYEYWSGCGESGHDNYSGGEPSEPNVTANSNRATIKWASLIAAATPMPTTSNADCTQCDPQPNPVAAGTVGAFEGARYFHCGCFRPAYDCMMRNLSGFCGVCIQRIQTTMAPYMQPTSITLTTPSIAFTNIPEGIGGTGVTTYRAIVFEIVACAPITLQITSGPTGGFGTPLGTSVVVPPGALPIAIGRLWLSYTSTTAGSSSVGSVTVHCPETNQTWVINITANTVARPKSAVVFVLDHSGSMSEDAGGGTTKVQKLREAANIFVNVMLQGDGLGIVRFDDTAQIIMPVTDVGPATIGSGRLTATGHINSSELDPAGATSIGDGVVKGKQALDTVQSTSVPPYDVTAMLVLTDGVENTPPMLASVGSSITAHTFAIGLGTPQNISTAALNTLTQGHNGYLLITGPLTPDQASRLDKYFLQILAGIDNANVVLDPQGELVYGIEHRIPFVMTEADMGMDVILLSPLPSIIDFELETPDGNRIDPAQASGSATIEFVSANGVSYYRIGLPALPYDPSGTHGGTWQAVLRLGRKAQGNNERSGFERSMTAARALPYNLLVHAYSNLQFKAQVQQKSFEPGAELHVYASLMEYDVPMEGRARVWAEVTRPDGSKMTLTLSESDAGQFQGHFSMMLTGLYTVRVRAQGSTLRGNPFTREQTLSAAVYPGGDRTPDGSDQGWRDRLLCELLNCLLGEQVIGSELIRGLEARGVNLKVLIRCLERYCRALSASRVDERRAPETSKSAEGVDVLQLLQHPELQRMIQVAVREASKPRANPDFARVTESDDERASES